MKQSVAITVPWIRRAKSKQPGVVNEKIEGFSDVCKAAGLTGRHGVIAPASNVQHQMLREDVVEAVASAAFRIFAVETIDEADRVANWRSRRHPDRAGGFPRVSQRAR